MNYKTRVLLAIARAWAATTKKAKYILGEGGRDPTKDHPFTPDKKGTLGSDCIGFVLWCLGLDRYQPKRFPLWAGWMNTDSIITDAKTRMGGSLWALVERPQLGDLVVYPSVWKNGKHTYGHVAVVVEVPAEWPDDWRSWSAKERKNLLRLVKVIDCNASLSRRLRGRAIGVLTAADLWNRPDAVFVRYIGDR